MTRFHFLHVVCFTLAPLFVHSYPPGHYERLQYHQSEPLPYGPDTARHGCGPYGSIGCHFVGHHQRYPAPSHFNAPLQYPNEYHQGGSHYHRYGGQTVQAPAVAHPHGFQFSHPHGFDFSHPYGFHLSHKDYRPSQMFQARLVPAYGVVGSGPVPEEDVEPHVADDEELPLGEEYGIDKIDEPATIGALAGYSGVPQSEYSVAVEEPVASEGSAADYQPSQVGDKSPVAETAPVPHQESYQEDGAESSKQDAAQDAAPSEEAAPEIAESPAPEMAESPAPE